MKPGFDSAQKILNRTALAHSLAYWRFKGMTLVFTNGCFDLMHPGHVTYLEEARSLGDVLVIGLNTDASVQRLKGPSRPIVPEHARARVLAALQCVDAVVLFDEDTPYALIQEVQPDVLVKGADYSVEQIVGADIVLAKGGLVKPIALVPGFSTSDIVQKILSNPS